MVGYDLLCTGRGEGVPRDGVKIAANIWRACVIRIELVQSRVFFTYVGLNRRGFTSQGETYATLRGLSRHH